MQSYLTGNTLQQIGEKLGISRQRVWQLLMAAGYDVRNLKATAAQARGLRLFETHRAAIHRMLAEGHSPSRVASALRVPLKFIKKTDARNPEYSRLRKALRRQKSVTYAKYTDEEVLECLRAASQELGGVLTTAFYTEVARDRTFPDRRPWPTHQTPVSRFGSWRAALEAAGLVSNPSSPIAGRRLFEEAHCVDAILEVERVLGELPTVVKYEAYAAKMGGVLPSVATIRNRFGSWQRALRRAVEFASSFEAD